MARSLIYSTLIVLCTGVIWACAVKPKGAFSYEKSPARPDYSSHASWAALPFIKDSADILPGLEFEDKQSESDLDVFFVHPTTYTGKRGQNTWNASMSDGELNERTDKTTIKYQATIFNGVGRIYAPRYRQAHLETFYTKKRQSDADQALDLAYEDVKSAFDYYLKNHNNGRPYIIAGHSQGTWHAARLIRDIIEPSDDYNRLIAAYLIGMPVTNGYFAQLEPCLTPEQTGCFCTWRTVKDGYYPKGFYKPDAGVIVTNPLLWSISDSTRAPKELNKGAVLKEFYDGPVPALIDARIDDGLLMVTKPKIPGVPINLMRNYHIADLNFYYVNVRENAQLRAETYFRGTK